MTSLRKSQERGFFDHGWLKTFHSFSFGEYYDPAHMGFRVLRVINEDRVEPGRGFGEHPHRDMEIITYVIEGELAHRDSMGNQSVIYAGDVQYMSAGTGVRHSEFNHSPAKPVHLLQIWILPDRRQYAPRYGQISVGHKHNGLKLVVSPDGRDGSIAIRQDAKIYLGRFNRSEGEGVVLDSGRSGWVQLIRGSLKVNGILLAPGDGAALSQEINVQFWSEEDSTEFLFFDLN